MRALWVTALLVTVTLAGCADGSQETPSGDDGTFQDIDTKATATTGVIRGVVFDPTIVPIEGAKVVIKSLQMETSTSAEGAFVFEKAEPGTHFLSVTRSGYEPVQVSVPVEAGVDKPPIVKVQLQANPSLAPTVDGYVFDGFIQCSWVAVAAALAMCSVPELAGVDLGDEFLQRVDVKEYPDFVQGELVWESTQSLGEALAFSVYDGTTTAPRRTEGASPRVLQGDRAFWENGTESDKSGSPMVAPGEQLAWRVFAGAHPSTVPPCTGICLWGVGVTVEQRFNIYTHAFYNWTPDQEWLFVVDGAPVPPT